MPADRTWSCHWASGLISFVHDELGRGGLIRPWSVPEDGGGFLVRCTGCRKGKRYCKGWLFDFSGQQALRFVPSKLRRGATVNVSLEGRFDFRRSDVPKRLTDWSDFPAKAMNVAVTVESEAGELLTRHHLDLANAGQPGPLWHLQLGGVPVKGTALSGIDVPRWPAWPVDFLLMVEFTLFNFFPDEWDRIRETAGWKAALKQSEELVLPHYLQRYEAYRGASSPYASWLAAQCARTSGWDPRPG